MVQHLAFTTKISGRVRVLTNKVKIGEAATLEEVERGGYQLREYTAIWDTGATNSAITQRVVRDLGLKPSGVAEVRHAKGKSSTNTYLINIGLPSRSMFGQVRVTEADLIPDDGADEKDHTQVLIGMDIIGAGDFAVTNFNGRTTFSYCQPSLREIDFIPEAHRNNLGETRAERRIRERELKKRGIL
ncbi:TPA: hypothetical protein DIV48_01540 [Candidatus Kaiserbacteria bacterium]|nr:MAG: SEC-C motif domain protein [Parcubacteria group bacterium GW2011_GWA1_56_13]KKW46472.1 MAG: SEC-C motif domain protein [Parcubacteria group bacterium GW2011_GWB1_57_6]HCR52316.1 hypothetical protein [Candidatus Kaiserbacteria bacterium]